MQLNDMSLLCKPLKNNSCLQELGLFYNQIKDKKCFIGQCPIKHFFLVF